MTTTIEVDESGREMTTTHFLRWGRLAPYPAKLRGRLTVYTHAGQARIVELDKAELRDLIDQAENALAAVHRAEGELDCASCGHPARHHMALTGQRCVGGLKGRCGCTQTRTAVVEAAASTLGVASGA